MTRVARHMPRHANVSGDKSRWKIAHRLALAPYQLAARRRPPHWRRHTSAPVCHLRCNGFRDWLLQLGLQQGVGYSAGAGERGSGHAAWRLTPSHCPCR